MAKPSKAAALMGNPYNPEAPTEIKYFNGQRAIRLAGGLEPRSPGFWGIPGDKHGPLFNGRGVHVIDDRGAIYGPPIVMAVNYQEKDIKKDEKMVDDDGFWDL